jgi:hypothetical protein
MTLTREETQSLATTMEAVQAIIGFLRTLNIGRREIGGHSAYLDDLEARLTDDRKRLLLSAGITE